MDDNSGCSAAILVYDPTVDDYWLVRQRKRVLLTNFVQAINALLDTRKECTEDVLVEHWIAGKWQRKK